MFSKYGWDNIAQENYWCSFGPERTDILSPENRLFQIFLVVYFLTRLNITESWLFLFDVGSGVHLRLPGQQWTRADIDWTIIIGTIYRYPRKDVTEFNNILNNLLKKLIKKKNSVFLRRFQYWLDALSWIKNQQMNFQIHLSPTPILFQLLHSYIIQPSYSRTIIGNISVMLSQET